MTPTTRRGDAAVDDSVPVWARLSKPQNETVTRRRSRAGRGSPAATRRRSCGVPGPVRSRRRRYERAQPPTASGSVYVWAARRQISPSGGQRPGRGRPRCRHPDADGDARARRQRAEGTRQHHSTARAALPLELDPGGGGNPERHAHHPHPRRVRDPDRQHGRVPDRGESRRQERDRETRPGLRPGIRRPSQHQHGRHDDPANPCDAHLESGWPDSNRRLSAPKADTLTRLSYTPPSGDNYSRLCRSKVRTAWQLAQTSSHFAISARTFGLLCVRCNSRLTSATFAVPGR